MALDAGVDNRFTKQVQNDVNAIMNSSVGSLQKWNKVLEVLVSSKIAYKRTLSVDEVFVHPAFQCASDFSNRDDHRS